MIKGFDWGCIVLGLGFKGLRVRGLGVKGFRGLGFGVWGSREWRTGKAHGNYDCRLAYRDYWKDAVFHSLLTRGKFTAKLYEP